MKTLIFLAALITAGCGVRPEAFEEAKRLCEPHGGLDYLYVFPSEIWCKNGVEIHLQDNYGK